MHLGTEIYKPNIEAGGRKLCIACICGFGYPYDVTSI